ncbi:MFS transporter [Chloroflexia bacterium SDU3-3]|nr:MFS transporter [Chloroflexia bacterium SDU3-3]
MYSILRNRALVTIGIAEGVSNIGNWINTMAIFALLLFRGGGGVAESSGIFLAGLVPTLLVSPLAGWLCDRFDRKRLMIASELLSGLMVVGLIFAQHTTLIYALLVCQAICGAVMGPARRSSIPQIVAPEQLPKANALLEQIASLIKIAAPLLAGGLLAVLSPHQALILDVISFAISAIILAWLPKLPPAAAPSQHAAAPKSSLGGTLRGNARLALLMALGFSLPAVVMGFDVLASLLVRDSLGGDERLYGLLIGAIGAGSLASTAIVMLRRRAADPWRDATVGIVILAALPAAMAAAAITPRVGALPLLICSIGAGVGIGLITMQVSTLIQQMAPPALLGQVSGMFQSFHTAGQLVPLLVLPMVIPALISIGLYFGMMCAALLLLAAATQIVLGMRRFSPPEQAEPGRATTG